MSKHHDALWHAHLEKTKQGFERVKAMPKGTPVNHAPKRDYKAEFLQQIALAGLYEPVLEFRFHPKRMWRWDFAWLVYKPNNVKLMVAVEYQGLKWKPKGDDAAKSGHQSIQGIVSDMEKYSEGSLLGWTIILINAKTVESGQALAWVERALKGRG